MVDLNVKSEVEFMRKCVTIYDLLDLFRFVYTNSHISYKVRSIRDILRKRVKECHLEILQNYSSNPEYFTDVNEILFKISQDLYERKITKRDYSIL